MRIVNLSSNFSINQSVDFCVCCFSQYFCGDEASQMSDVINVFHGASCHKSFVLLYAEYCIPV